MDCIHQDTCEYAQPFFVGAKGRWGAYLPALCDPSNCRDYESASRPMPAPEKPRPLYPMLDRIKAELTHVHNSLHEMQAKRKKPKPQTTSEIEI